MIGKPMATAPTAKGTWRFHVYYSMHIGARNFIRLKLFILRSFCLLLTSTSQDKSRTSCQQVSTTSK